MICIDTDNSRLGYSQKISLVNKSEEDKRRIIKLFEDNKNIAYKIASKYYKTNYWDYDESLQIAQMGLFKACLIWDPNKYKLSTLAYNIINRDFIDFDKQQKRQPDIIMSLDEEIEDADMITIGDILQDPKAQSVSDVEEKDSVSQMNEDILYILDDIADDLGIQRSVVKMIYLVYIESSNYKGIGGQIRFVKKATMNTVIEQLQIRLQNLIDLGEY